MILNENAEIFVIHIIILLTVSVIQIYKSYHFYISLWLVDKVFMKVLSKYLDYINIFLFDLIIELSQNTLINKYVIILIKSKQPSYKSIYSFKLVELKTLKTY